MKKNINCLVAVCVLLSQLASPALRAQEITSTGKFPQPVVFDGDGDHRNMMEQLGIKALRPGADPNNQNTFDEANVNPHPLPELMVMKNGTKVTDAGQWKARWAEIMEDFEREVYGRIPQNVPSALGQRREDAAPAADQPVPRSDPNSQLAHAQLLEKAKRGRIDVYFVGDSITRRWGTSDEQYKAFLSNWRQNFFGWNAANFGWGGDTTQNILWRLHNGELDDVNPRVIVLMAGTNNVGDKSPQGSDDPRVADVTRGIKAILDLCRQKSPKATIVLMGITPRNDNMAVMPIINKINENIAKFADGKRVIYVNINDRLADKEGKLLEGMADKDGLHLDVKGYQAWADALKPILTRLLGPPAKEDHAPPPTGDPSTVKRAPSQARRPF